ncbi:MAG: hypothetical protein JEZ11_00900 [Desulfobacterales bacterium]|nr:hypothetical protein [Desulfobacterales bacterium]
MENNDPIKRPEDRGGRRRITDRRVRVSHCDGTERRMGLRRRSGFDRRLRKGLIERFESRKTAH